MEVILDETLKKIANVLRGIHYDDLTKAEQKIAKILIDQNYLILTEDKNFL